MTPDEYTPEQRQDIEARVAKAKAMLDELQLEPQVLMTVRNVGDDVFGVKPIPYLQDKKYTPAVVSPIQQ